MFRSCVVGPLLAAVALSSAMINPAAAEESAYLEEIVVTAQKREQAYVDVPLSVANIDSYAVFDLTIGAESNDGKWAAAVFAKNLFDENYTNVLIETPLDGVGGTSQFLNRDFERYIGGRFEYRFGQ